MSASDQQLIEQIHASGKQLVLSVTGGGSGAISALLEVPGASATVLEAVVPYASTALQDWLGGPIDHYCSERTARAMAMASFERARKLSDADPASLCGIGATASLATTRPKLSEHRIHVARQTFDTTAVVTCELEKGQRTRTEEEEITTRLILATVADGCGVEGLHSMDPRIVVRRRDELAPDAWTDLLLGRRDSVLVAGKVGATAAIQGQMILFPGAFNPPHVGHERMAEIASRKYGHPVLFELSVSNVDKPKLDFIEIADRLAQLKGRPVLLTRAATFVEKARTVPECIFIVGIDTLERIADSKYYGGDSLRRNSAIMELAGLGCRFLVFGRSTNGQFAHVTDLNLPAPLRELCDEVSEEEFREDITSTELRSG